MGRASLSIASPSAMSLVEASSLWSVRDRLWRRVVWPPEASSVRNGNCGDMG